MSDGRKMHTKLNRASAVCLATLLLACTAGGTLVPEDCIFQGIHETTSPPTDLGNGLISFRFDQIGYHGGPDSDWGQLETMFLDCETGQVVVSRSNAQRSDASYKFDKSKAVEEILRELPNVDILTAKGMQAYLVEKAQAKSVPLRQHKIEEEACGCRVFYPDLRGDKTAYEVK